MTTTAVLQDATAVLQDAVLNNSIEAVCDGHPTGNYRKCYYGIKDGVPYVTTSPCDTQYIYIEFSRDVDSYYTIDCRNGATNTPSLLPSPSPSPFQQSIMCTRLGEVISINTT